MYHCLNAVGKSLLKTRRISHVRKCGAFINTRGMLVQLIVYANSEADSRQRLLDEVAKIPELSLLCVNEHKSFTKILRQGLSAARIIVFMACNQDDLAFILSINELLSNSRLILILPDRDEKSIRKGHLMYPRFQSYADGDFKDVAVVLENMLKQNLTKHQGRP